MSKSTLDEAARYLDSSLGALAEAVRRTRADLREIRKDGELDRIHPDWPGDKAFVIVDRAQTVERAAQQYRAALLAKGGAE